MKKVVNEESLPKTDPMIHAIVVQCREKNPDQRPDLDFVLE